MSEQKKASDPSQNIRDRCEPDCGSFAEAADGLGGPYVDVTQLLGAVRNRAQERRLIFRGGSREQRLHSSFDRSIQNAEWTPTEGMDARHMEHAIFRSFVRKAHLRISDPPPEHEILEWLAYMRHYTAPTRLLDWTYSAWIGLFFAAAGTGGGTRRLWVVDTERLEAAAKNVLATGKLKAAYKAHGMDLHCREKATFAGLYNAKVATRFVLKQNSWRMNPRVAVQQGLFLCPGDIKTCFQSNLAALAPPVDGGLCDAVTCIDFDAKLAKEILVELSRYGVSYESLYPDLDGLAKDLQLLPMVPSRHAFDLKLGGLGEPAQRKP